MNYHFKYFINENGEYYAEGIELKDCQIGAKTFENLKIIIQDILDLYLNENFNSNIIPSPSKKEIIGKNIIAVSL